VKFYVALSSLKFVSCIYLVGAAHPASSWRICRVRGKILRQEHKSFASFALTFASLAVITTNLVKTNTQG